jgi:hypothetical protein
MNWLSKLLEYMKNPYKIVNYFGSRGKLKFLPDKLYLKLIFHARMGYRLNLDLPITYNEKLQWLKLYDRRPEYTLLVDKLNVREYIKEMLGEEYLIPLLGVFDRFHDIDFDLLPEQFVLKCTHDSGSSVLCKDKIKLNMKAIQKRLENSLKRNFYYPGREWPYKEVKPKIICEKYMQEDTGEAIKDYKFLCFYGEPIVIYVVSDKDRDIRYDYFDQNFNHQPFTQQEKNSDKAIKKPVCFNQMLEFAKLLSRNIPHVRVDFYEINGKVYFGEITFFNDSGFRKFSPELYDKVFGSYIQLPK